MGLLNWRTLLPFAVFLSLAWPIHAAPGHVFGLVVYGQEEALEGVTVRLSSKKYGLVRETVTGRSGEFRFRQLRKGTYSLEFELGGFGGEARKDFEVLSSMTSNYDVEMGLQVGESVLFTGQLPLITRAESPERLVRNRAFLEAVLRGNIDFVRARIREGADLSHGQSALVAAIRTRNDAVLEVLIEAGTDVNAPAHEQWTALMAATSARRVRAVRQLLRAGVDVNGKGKEGEKPVGLAARYGYGEIVALLLKAGANVDSRDEHGRTPLIRGVGVEGSRMLLEAGADIDARDDRGETALIRAVLNLPRSDPYLRQSRALGLDVVHTLLISGAGPDASDADGRSALVTALLQRDLGAARALALWGADVPVLPERAQFSKFGWLEAKDAEPLFHELASKRSAIQRLLDRERCEAETAHATTRREGQYLSCRCRTRSVRVDAVRSRVLQDEAFGPSELGRTALMSAAGSGRIDVVHSLLDGGSDVNATDDEGRTSVMRAAVVGRADIVQVLLSAGAEGGLPLDGGMRALELAAASGHAEIVRLLLKAGVDPNWTDAEGRTTAMLAALMGHKGIARELRKAQRNGWGRLRRAQSPLAPAHAGSI